MLQAQKTRDVIIALKKVREEHGYSHQRIYNMVQDNGGNVSLATVKRVFADGSEDQNFRYEDSIKPIASVLLDITAEAVKTEENSEIATLKAIILSKEETIASERRKVAHLLAENEKKDKLLDERGDFIRERGEFMRQKDADLKRERIKSAILTALLIVCLLVIIVALVIDRTNPNMGFFWMDRVSSFVTGESMSFITGL